MKMADTMDIASILTVNLLKLLAKLHKIQQYSMVEHTIISLI